MSRYGQNRPVLGLFKACLGHVCSYSAHSAKRVNPGESGFGRVCTGRYGQNRPNMAQNPVKTPIYPVQGLRRGQNGSEWGQKGGSRGQTPSDPLRPPQTPVQGLYRPIYPLYRACTGPVQGHMGPYGPETTPNGPFLQSNARSNRGFGPNRSKMAQNRPK